ncbi:MAG: prolyl-tRNA synthetase associated domain-containing protein [Erysipelotrichaceae bacterium]|nr:prolyl-tRNA synthetase associated domain-containing protein [Erysipelotrichaceae bacterium]
MGDHERESRELRVYTYLDYYHIDYKRIDHPRANTMEDCVAISEALGAPICKNLLLCNRQQTLFYLLMMPGDKPFKTKELSKQINSARLSFASAERMLEFLDIEPGSLSVMGLINDINHRVQLLIDEDLLKLEEIGCHPCVNTSSIKIKTSDLLNVFLPSVEHEPITVVLKGY